MQCLGARTSAAIRLGYRALGTLSYHPISPFQRIALAASSAIGAIINPERGDLIATLGEVTGMHDDVSLPDITSRRILLIPMLLD